MEHVMLNVNSFEQSPHEVTVLLKSTQLFATCYWLVVGIVVIILSFVRLKQWILTIMFTWHLLVNVFIYIDFPLIF